MTVKIEDYGFIGDLETSALVSRNGSIDWLCLPHFDSGACFAALLGNEEHGCWRIGPAETVRQTRRQYRGESLILETEFETAGGSVRLIDCMPPRGKLPDVVRIVEGIRGRVKMAMKLVIRFDYGLAVPWVRQCEGGLLAVRGPDALMIRADVETRGENLSTVAEFEISEGERKCFVLTWHPSHTDPPEPVNPQARLRETEEFWREWAGRCTFRGPLRKDVLRSLITLKGLTFAPTGGVIAAPTTSLPERLGGVRNWDYRCCWMRDATFTLYAMMITGYTEEARAWRDWLLRAVAGNADQLQILYGLAGERQFAELELDWLPGYENSRPVRIGNAASKQFQLDIFGEIMDALLQTRRVGMEPEAPSWALQRHLMDHVCGHWREQDNGIWEVRGPRRDFTHSKVMAWVALDRAVKAVREFGMEADLPRWERIRDEIHAEVCARGFNAKRGAFTQCFDSENLDASLLMLPLVGFLPATDPRVRGTVEAIERELMRDGFVLRYDPAESADIDALPPGEGVFLPCSFWMADCLHLLGRREEARELFERLLAIRNDLGLLSEQYDTGLHRLIGNFPQAFSHVGLVNTAGNLSKSAGPAAHRCEQCP
jgi:GH15 family glucan-1,4-alpha-glucosidase